MNYWYSLITLLFFNLLVTKSNGQFYYAKLKGNVINNKKEKIRYADIIISFDKTETKIKSDSDGSYEINLFTREELEPGLYSEDKLPKFARIEIHVEYHIGRSFCTGNIFYNTTKKENIQLIFDKNNSGFYQKSSCCNWVDLNNQLIDRRNPGIQDLSKEEFDSIYQDR
jgi:hypothetical protein